MRRRTRCLNSDLLGRPMDETDKRYVSEDESAGYASPVFDLIATLALVLLSIWVMAESVALKVPGGLATAPGLLPFLTAGTLCLMALALGADAWRRHQSNPVPWSRDIPEEMPRTAVLIVILISYVAAIQFLSFESTFAFAGVTFTIGSFEIISIIVLTVIFRIFWTNLLWACASVSVVWIMALALVFRNVFKIPLPG